MGKITSYQINLIQNWGPLKTSTNDLTVNLSDRVGLSRRFHGCWLLTLATLANPWLTASSAREVHRSHALRHSMAGVSATGGVKMQQRFWTFVSCGNTNCIQMSKIDAEPHSLIFSSGASFGVLSSQNFSPANSKVHSHAFLWVIATFRPWKYGLIHQMVSKLWHCQRSYSY